MGGDDQGRGCGPDPRNDAPGLFRRFGAGHCRRPGPHRHERRHGMAAGNGTADFRKAGLKIAERHRLRECRSCDMPNPPPERIGNLILSTKRKSRRDFSMMLCSRKIPRTIVKKPVEKVGKNKRLPGNPRQAAGLCSKSPDSAGNTVDFCFCPVRFPDFPAACRHPEPPEPSAVCGRAPSRSVRDPRGWHIWAQPCRVPPW
ncbi:hypothetical protein DFP89_10948 [Paracoccus lutimaris]|uniref:Uncharacterized protein n=1 Tax=Paracoccus lutimaris TaxID=1490030 RepID=A0A368YY20_9RHOB|nr:hypothetical protein DFP89_10948 [Paracoccus lutimaris]